MHQTNIVWLKNDLRLGDNQLIQQAMASGEPFVLLYIDNIPDSSSHDNPWPIQGASRWWLAQSLAKLQAEVNELNGHLIIRQGQAEKILPAIAQQLNSQCIFTSRSYEPYQRELDRRLSDQLSVQGISFKRICNSLLQEPEQVLTQSQTPFKVFTPYYHAWLKHYQPPVPAAKPDSLPGIEQKLDSLPPEALIASHPWQQQLADNCAPGETAANEKLNRFMQTTLIDYLDQRDTLAANVTSGLSPHLRFGEISIRQVLFQLEQLASEYRRDDRLQKAISGFIRELVWREFAYAVLYHFPHTTDQPFNDKFARFPWRKNYQRDLKKWQRGETGIPIIDAAMRELWQTGIMHNRMRMVVASFLTKNLMIPWQEGARWFWDTLVDADLANNSFGWQWSAGCGLDAAPYFRIFNPLSQAQKFDADGRYLQKWLPELNALPVKWQQQPWAAKADLLGEAELKLGRDYPEPMVDLGESRKAALAAYQHLKKG